jgi:DNA-directed RNA polymerase subunit M/transcription elongation factor TFIIS
MIGIVFIISCLFFTMRFCSQCDNMLYMKMNDDDSSLHLFCRFCEHVEPLPLNSTVIINTHLPSTEKNFEHFINPYTKYDPSLPRVDNVFCKDVLCPSHVEEENTKKKKIIYIRYDNLNMKYLYLCPTCDCTWKAN